MYTAARDEQEQSTSTSTSARRGTPGRVYSDCSLARSGEAQVTTATAVEVNAERSVGVVVGDYVWQERTSAIEDRVGPTTTELEACGVETVVTGPSRLAA